jgi:hypothetical protein
MVPGWCQSGHLNPSLVLVLFEDGTVQIADDDVGHRPLFFDAIDSRWRD